MEAVQNVQINPAVMSGVIQGRFAAPTDGGNPIFATLLAGMLEGPGFEELLAGLGLADESSEKESEKNAALMMADMLLGTPLFDAMLMNQAVEGQSAGSIAGMSDLLRQALGETQAARTAAIPDEKPIDEDGDAKQVPFEVLFRGIGDSEKPTSDLWSAFEDRRGMQDAIRDVRQTQQKTRQDQKEIDVDQLQSLADSRRSTLAQTIQAAKAASASAEAPPIVEQMKTGILENLADGKGEFVIKLKPDGLGEITVKIIERQGQKMSLSILASDPAVAKMITAEAASLQNALRPLQVELHEVMTRQGLLGEAAAYAGQDHQGTDQHRQPHDDRKPNPQRAEWGLHAVDGLSTDDELLALDGLDTYV